MCLSSFFIQRDFVFAVRDQQHVKAASHVTYRRSCEWGTTNSKCKMNLMREATWGIVTTRKGRKDQAISAALLARRCTTNMSYESMRNVYKVDSQIKLRTSTRDSINSNHLLLVEWSAQLGILLERITCLSAIPDRKTVRFARGLRLISFGKKAIESGDNVWLVMM